VIVPTDLPGIDESTANRIIAFARSIAPCLDSLADGPERDGAIAVLLGVAKEVKGRGSRHIASQGIGPANVRYVDVQSCFFPDDRAALRALCAASTPTGGPVGHFPAPGRTVSSLWPERYDS
jgi:hypothetical protein